MPFPARTPVPKPSPPAAALAVILLAGCTSGSGDPGGTAPEEDTGTAREAYTEDFRPRFHYSPAEGNMADPNGMLWFDDEFHLFHQQDGTWAHAVASDLVHWEELPTALEHDELGQALSGSAVVDGGNTSGLFPDTDRGMVAIYTNTEGGEAQSIAHSRDDGRTWERYEHNPVIPNDGREDFRDPKVFWHEETRAWIMVVSTGQAVEVFSSPDLLDWEFRSGFGHDQGLQTAVWECPELFPLAVDGDPEDTRWVLAVSVGDNEETGGSTAQYFVGDFDGETFTNTNPADEVLVTDLGQDFYAAQSFTGGPDERRVWMGWVGNWRHPYSAPTEDWKNHMSVPRSLSLETVDGQVRLVQEPVAELDQLRGEPFALEDTEIDGVLPLDVNGRSFEFEAEIDLGEAEEAGLRVFDGDASGTEEWFAVGGNTEHDEFVMDRSHAGVDTLWEPEREEDVEFGLRRAAHHVPEDGVLRLRGYVDEASVEVFVDGGALTGTMLAYPTPGNDGIALYSSGSTAVLESLTVYPMDPIR